MGRPLTFDQQTIELIRKLAADGVRVPEIAKRIGRHRSGVWTLMKRLGIPRQPHWNFPRLDKNPSWRGGQWIDKDGYRMIYTPGHPNATYGGYVREHRLVMEKKLGRYLTSSEVVHHKDGNKLNNSIRNLKLYGKNSDHLRDESSGRVPNWSEDGKRRIREGIRRSAKKRRVSTQTG